jgi:arylsulfatase A-like enzyme
VVVRHNEWKGIWNADTLLLELYDLASDPGEQLDLSAENPALADEFRTRAQQWLEACAANRLNPVEGQQLDEATKEQLRALGYL